MGKNQLFENFSTSISPRIQGFYNSATSIGWHAKKTRMVQVLGSSSRGQHSVQHRRDNLEAATNRLIALFIRQLRLHDAVSTIAFHFLSTFFCLSLSLFSIYLFAKIFAFHWSLIQITEIIIVVIKRGRDTSYDRVQNLTR